MTRRSDDIKSTIEIWPRCRYGYCRRPAERWINDIDKVPIRRSMIQYAKSLWTIQTKEGVYPAIHCCGNVSADVNDDVI